MLDNLDAWAYNVLNKLSYALSCKTIDLHTLVHPQPITYYKALISGTCSYVAEALDVADVDLHFYSFTKEV